MLNPWILLGWVVAFCLAVLIFLIRVVLVVAIVSAAIHSAKRKSNPTSGPVPTSLEAARRLHPSSRQRL